MKKTTGYENEIGILYIIKSIGTMKSMPISVQEVVLNDQLDQKERRLEPCVTRRRKMIRPERDMKEKMK